MNSYRGKMFAFKLSAIFIGVIFAIIICELLLRAVYVNPVSPNIYFPLGQAAGKTLTLDQKEYCVDFRYNSHGFRGEDFPGSKPSNQRRIVVLGDSFAEGMGVSEDQRFSAALGHLMTSATNEKWIDINLGQVATSPISYFNNLVNLGASFEPDVVILALFLGNDFMGGRSLPCPKTYQLVTMPQSNSRVLDFQYIKLFSQKWTRGSSPLLRRTSGSKFWEVYFKEPIDREFFQRKLGLELDEFNRLSAGVDPGVLADSFSGRLNPSFLFESIALQKTNQGVEPYYNEADFRNVLDTIEEASKVTNKLKSRFVVLVIADIFQIYPEEFEQVCKKWGMSEVPSRVKQLAVFKTRIIEELKEKGIEFVDPTEALRRAREKTYYIFDTHWTEVGHRIAAEELSNHLLAKGAKN